MFDPLFSYRLENAQMYTEIEPSPNDATETPSSIYSENCGGVSTVSAGPSANIDPCTSTSNNSPSTSITKSTAVVKSYYPDTHETNIPLTPQTSVNLQCVKPLLNLNYNKKDTIDFFNGQINDSRGIATQQNVVAKNQNVIREQNYGNLDHMISKDDNLNKLPNQSTTSRINQSATVTYLPGNSLENLSQSQQINSRVMSNNIQLVGNTETDKINLNSTKSQHANTVSLQCVFSNIASNNVLGNRSNYSQMNNFPIQNMNGAFSNTLMAQQLVTQVAALQPNIVNNTFTPNICHFNRSFFQNANSPQPLMSLPNLMNVANYQNNVTQQNGNMMNAPIAANLQMQMGLRMMQALYDHCRNVSR